MVEDTAAIVQHILQLYQGGTMKRIMEWKLRMGSAQDFKGKLSRKQQDPNAQDPMPTWHPTTYENFVAKYKNTFGKTPGIFFMDHARDHFKIVVNRHGDKPVNGSATDHTYTWITAPEIDNTKERTRECCCLLGT